MSGPRIHRRHLQARETPEGLLLAATKVDDGTHFAYLSGTKQVAIEARFGDDLLWHRQVAGGVVAVVGGSDVGDAAELEIHKNQRVIFAIRNGETAEDTVNWLRYHRAFGVTGALIFDRANPEGGEVFAGELAEIL